MKHLAAAIFILLVSSSCSFEKARSTDSVFQVSVIQALSKGVFDGDLTGSELLRHGNFGLGTFNDLDGEMIVLDGKLYQAKFNGSLVVPPKTVKIPFAAVKFFHKDKTFPLSVPSDYMQIKAFLDKVLVRKNIFYAIRVTGIFSDVSIRSVPPQIKPYPSLAQAVSEQNVFKLSNVSGTMIGFWFPEYAKEFNASGYHFHFIDAAHRHGGHVLDVKILHGAVAVDRVTELSVVLPQTADFDSADLSIEPTTTSVVEK